MVRGDGAGRGGGVVVQYVRGVDAQRFAVEGGVGDGRRVVGADFAVKGGDGCVPVKARLGFVEFVRVGDAVCRLGRRLAGLREDVRHGAQQGGAAERHQAVVQAGGGVVGGDGQARFCPDRAGIQAFIHLHDADAGLRVACFDGALDGGGTAPARQQRGVDVKAAKAGVGEKPRRQEQAVSGDDDEVRARQFGKRRRVGVQFFRLGDGEVMCERGFFDGAGGEFAPASGWAVGLGKDAVNGVVAAVNQCLQVVRGEGGGAGKPEAGAHVSRSFCKRDLASFFSRRSRFKRERWSIKRTPFKWSISCWMHTPNRPSASPSQRLPPRS